MKLFPPLAVVAGLAMLSAAPASAAVCNQNACSTRLMGVVSSGPARGAKPVQGAKVYIFRAGVAHPVLLSETVSDARGQFSASLPKQGNTEIRYLVALKDRTELMTVMAAGDRPHVRVNEMTTVASAYAMAQFINGKEVSGKPLPLQVAAGMFRNLTAPDKGEVSDVLRRAPNADQTNARRLMATLSNVLANCVRNGAFKSPIDSCTALTTVTGGATTLEAAINIARNPASEVPEIFALGNAVQPFQPALLDTQGPAATDELMRLDAFTVAVKVNRTSARPGPERCPIAGPGNLVFDDKGYAWVTNNVVAGTTVSAKCFMVLKPNGMPADGKRGTPNSPLFGGGVLGQGFGIGRDPSGNIWAGNFGWGGVNPVGSVSEFSSDGKPLSPAPNGFVSNLDRVQGTASDQQGNIWMASYGNSRIQVFPAGNPYTDYPYYADDNSEPFHIMIDDDGAAYVSYTATSALSKFTYSPSGIALYKSVAIGSDANPKGIGLDTTGHVWATAGAESKVYLFDSELTPIGDGYDGGSITGPWGLSVDSRDNVWVANFGPDDQTSLKYRVTQLCGTNESNCPPGLKTGDGISPATGWTLPSGGDQVRLASGRPLYYPVKDPSYKPLMRATTTQIDMAGNVWVTNNWKPVGPNDVASNPGGDGLVIFVGMAAPVKPGIGLPKAP